MNRVAWILLLLATAGFVAWWMANGVDLSPAERLESAIGILDSGNIDASALKKVSADITTLRQDPETVPAAELLDAIVLLRGDRVAAALRKLSTLDQESSLRPEILLYAGEALYRLQRYSEAARVLGVVVAEDPDNLPAHRWLSATLYDLGAFNLAIAELNEVVRLDPSDYRPHHLLGIMYEDFEQHGEAVKHFNEALALNPDFATRQSILVELSRAKIALREDQDAMQLLQQASPSGTVSLLLAICSLNLGQTTEARQHLSQAIAQQEDSWQRYLLEADLAQAEVDPNGAISVLEVATDKFPQNAELRYRLALALQAAGKTEAAEHHLQLWETSRDLAARLTELNLQAIEDPYNADVRRQLADVCRQLGKPELADMWLAAAQSCQLAATLPVPE